MKYYQDLKPYSLLVFMFNVCLSTKMQIPWGQGVYLFFTAVSLESKIVIDWQ